MCVPCMGCMYSPVVVGPWLLFACRWERLTLRPIGCENWLVTTVEKLLSRGWPNRAGLSLVRLWCLPTLSSECVITGCGQVVLRFFPKQPPSILPKGLLGDIPLQAKFSCSPFLAQSHLAWATTWSAGIFYLCWPSRCLGQAKLWTEAGYLSSELGAA